MSDGIRIGERFYICYNSIAIICLAVVLIALFWSMAWACVLNHDVDTCEGLDDYINREAPDPPLNQYEQKRVDSLDAAYVQCKLKQLK